MYNRLDIYIYLCILLFWLICTSNPDSGDRCTAARLLFDATDAGGGLLIATLYYLPNQFVDHCDPCETVTYCQIVKALAECYLLWGSENG